MIINWLYQSNSGYITIWGAAEVFSYYGTILAAILAAIVAVVGVHISIRASHEQYREDKRRDVLPYFAINLLDRQSINPVDWESMHKTEMRVLKYQNIKNTRLIKIILYFVMTS